MTHLKTNLKQIIIAGGALFVAIAAPIEASRLMGYDTSVISAAVARNHMPGRPPPKAPRVAPERRVAASPTRQVVATRARAAKAASPLKGGPY